MRSITVESFSEFEWIKSNVPRVWKGWSSLEWDFLTTFPKFSDDLIRTNEVVYQDCVEFSDYKGKSLLIMGGGASTNKMEWSKFSEYDYVWSVNHFFLHPTLRDNRVDLVMMMAEPDISNKKWIEYRDLYKPMVGFESSKRWLGYSFDDYDRYFCMHTKYYSLLGACPRMIIFACELGVKSIDFIGMDGYKSIIKGNHAFQPGKRNLPSSMHKFGDIHPHNVFKHEYNIYWEYVIDTFPCIQFNHLGGGEEYHEKIMRYNTG